jgi:hypothetical protein
MLYNDYTFVLNKKNNFQQKEPKKSEIIFKKLNNMSKQLQECIVDIKPAEIVTKIGENISINEKTDFVKSKLREFIAKSKHILIRFYQLKNNIENEHWWSGIQMNTG